MRRYVALLCILAGLSWAAPARAQSATTDELVSLLRDDLTALGVNMPVWMSQHLPGVMPATGIGAGPEIGDDAGGFKIGLLARLGFLNNFNDIGHGMQLVNLQQALPELMPWPQFGVVAAFGLGSGLELGGEVQFIPDMDIASDDLNLKAGLISVGATLRWRANKADGIVPAFLIGLGANYYHGQFELGVNHTGSYTEAVDGQTVEGTYTFLTAPETEWDLFQLSPEVRIAWDIGGVLRPYLGFGVGFTFGEVSDALRVRARLTVDRIDGQPANEDPVTYEDTLLLFQTDPALYTLRPHLGFDLVLGPIAFSAQLDFAVMGAQEVDGDFADAAGSFDSGDEGFLYNDARSGTQTEAALVLTMALRVQFE